MDDEAVAVENVAGASAASDEACPAVGAKRRSWASTTATIATVKARSTIWSSQAPPGVTWPRRRASWPSKRSVTAAKAKVATSVQCGASAKSSQAKGTTRTRRAAVNALGTFKTKGPGGPWRPAAFNAGPDRDG